MYTQKLGKLNTKVVVLALVSLLVIFSVGYAVYSVHKTNEAAVQQTYLKNKMNRAKAEQALIDLGVDKDTARRASNNMNSEQDVHNYVYKYDKDTQNMN